MNQQLKESQWGVLELPHSESVVSHMLLKLYDRNASDSLISISFNIEFVFLSTKILGSIIYDFRSVTATH